MKPRRQHLHASTQSRRNTALHLQVDLVERVVSPLHNTFDGGRSRCFGAYVIHKDIPAKVRFIHEDNLIPKWRTEPETC